MGSFAYTCAVSGLPIEVGDKVRYILLTKNPYHDGAGNTCHIDDLWFPRTIPLRASYNDYGSVEKVEAGPVRDLWLEALRIDLVEQGWGDNSVHDVPTSKDMSFEELLRAVLGGRILVSREAEDYELKRMREQHIRTLKLLGIEPKDRDEPGVRKTPPPGIPTLSVISDILAGADLPLFHGYGADGYLVDEVEYGYVRVRWHGGGENFGKDTEKLGEILPLFQDYAGMIAAGSGPYAHRADLLLRPKPGTENYHGAPKTDRRPLPLNHAMIREDVWQALLKVRTEIPLTALREAVREEAATRRELMTEDFSKSVLHSMSERGLVDWIFKNRIPYTVGLGTHLNLMLEKGAIPEDVLDAVAEFAHITCVLANCRYQWRPSAGNGPQSGDWEAHEEFAKALLKVIAKSAREERWNQRLGRLEDFWWSVRYRVKTWTASLLIALGLTKLPVDEGCGGAGERGGEEDQDDEGWKDEYDDGLDDDELDDDEADEEGEGSSDYVELTVTETDADLSEFEDDDSEDSDDDQKPE